MLIPYHTFYDGEHLDLKRKSKCFNCGKIIRENVYRTTYFMITQGFPQLPDIDKTFCSHDCAPYEIEIEWKRKSKLLINNNNELFKKTT